MKFILLRVSTVSLIVDAPNSVFRGVDLSSLKLLAELPEGNLEIKCAQISALKFFHRIMVNITLP